MGFIKNILKAHADKKDDFISEWYWRRKYNTLQGEMDQLLEVMRSDIYKEVLAKMTKPLELKRYKRENTRLRNKCKVLLEERNSLYDENKVLKKKGGAAKNGEQEEGIA